MNKRDLLDLLAFIISSAKGCINEPKMYGPFRLVDSISRIIEMLKKNGIPIDDDINKIVEKINNEKYSLMEDERQFISMLEKVSLELLELIKTN